MHSEKSGPKVVYGYDAQKRLISREGYEEGELQETRTYKYGNHTKFVPVEEYIADGKYIADFVLIRGLVEYTITEKGEERHAVKYTVDGDKINMKQYDSDILADECVIAYENDYPTTLTGEGEYEDEDEDGSPVVYTYSSKINVSYDDQYKFSKISHSNVRGIKGSDEMQTYIEEYTYLTTTPFILLISCVEMGVEYSSYQYTSSGMLTQETELDFITNYTDYVIDAHGNWTSRKVGENMSTRTISYWE